MAFGIDDIVGQGLKLVNKFIRDPAEKAKHEIEIKRLAQEGNLKELQMYVGLLQGQLEINKIEASSSSLFKGGWRPAVGWICAIAFGYKFVLQPFIIFIALCVNPEYPTASLPVLDWAEMAPVLFGILGLGGYRSWERSNNKA